MSLNLTEAWKDIPPPSPDLDSSPLPPPPGQSPQTSPIVPRTSSLVPQPSLFDHPLVTAPPGAPGWKPNPDRLQQLTALVLHRHEDPELDDILKKNPAWRAQAALDDSSMPARAMTGQQIAREVLGESGANEPGLYFLAVGEKLPQTATRQEAYAAICDHYTREAEQRYVDNKNRRAAWQKNRAVIEKAIPQVVSGLKTPAQLTSELSPEQLAIYNREFAPAAVDKAHAAFALLRQAFANTPEEGLRSMIDQGLSRQITSCLSDAAEDGGTVLNEIALELFEVSLKSLMSDVQDKSGDQYKFLHNVRLALFSPVRKRSDDLRSIDAALQAANQARDAAIIGNIAEAAGWESTQKNADAFQKRKRDEIAALQEEWLRHRAADTQEARVLGLLSQGQDQGNQPSEQASFTSKTINCLGSVTGQTLPFFIPYAGWSIALAGAFDDKRNRAYYAGLEPGTAEWSAFIDAAASTAVEKISFGAIGKFSGAGWLINKLPVTGKLRRTLSDALWTRVLFETGAGIAEETLAEPTAEAVIQWIARNNLAPLVKLDVGGNYDWNNYWQELQGMLSPDQFAATALFVGALAGMQAPSLRRTLVTYSKNEEMLMTQGIPKEEAQRIAAIENDTERTAAARQAREKAWVNYDQAYKNAKDGMAAFRHLGEVQATLESEAYKYFQEKNHFPTVEEKLDAPGTYAVTVYDRDTGKRKFTQDMSGDQLVTLFGQYFSRAEQQEVQKTQSEIAANAFLRSAEATGELQTQDMFQWGQEQSSENGQPSSPTPAPASEQSPANSQIVPRTSSLVHPPSPIVPRTSSLVPQDTSTLGGFIRTLGAMSQQAFSHLARIATQEYRRRTASGMTAQEAAAAPFASLSPYVPLGSLMELDKAFNQRLDIAQKTTGEEDYTTTRLFKMGTAPGSTPADTLFLLTRGHIGSRELLEDLFEWKLGKLTLGDPARLQAIGSLLRDTQATMQQLGFKGQFIEQEGDLLDMQIVEAMSKLALSDMLSNADSLPLPQWQQNLIQYHVNALGDAAYLLHIGQAYNAGRKAGTITQDMADILRDLGHQLHTIFDTAKIEQTDIQAVMDARAILASRDPSRTPTASQIRERQRRDEKEEKEHTTTSDQSKRLTPPPSSTPSTSPTSGQSPTNSKIVPRTSSLVHPPSSLVPHSPSPPALQDVFAGGASWNADAGTWLGMVPVDRLRLSPEVPQVKVGSGKKGVVNPLVGDYRADAPPIYVWKRSNGRLEVVSGRHRLDLAQRTGTKNIAAYVYEEDATHDTRWARLLDYEQNMQDDQADELTAAIYVRETGLTDAELTRRGLTRSGTKSRRGLLIGREARQELWGRFGSGLIKAQDAEAICLLTQHIQDKTRIDAIQAQAAADLANGKSLDFAAAKIQLMIHAPQDGMVQGLISFGASFDEALERSADYVTRCIVLINEHIGAIKGVRTISKKGSVMESEGITAGLSADPAERLRELELLKAMYEKIGLYENLRLRALTWDGKTPPDPIGDHRLDMQAERARAAEDAAALENEENRKASEALTPELTFSLTPSRDPETAFPALWRQASRELNARGQVSFSLSGSRIAIHTISAQNFRHALEMGGMPNPAVQIADLDSGPTHYGEIACILHPERIDPAKTPGARIFRGDAWTRTMPEKITEDGDEWDEEEHSRDEAAWFYDEHGDLREWNRENLDAYMKSKHLDSFLPHNMTPDDVLDNYGEDGGAIEIIIASQAYAAEFGSLREAVETDDRTGQLDRREAEQAATELKDSFQYLLDSCYFEPRALQKFLMGYWWKDISRQNVRQALIGDELLDDPDTLYDEEENPEEYNDLQSSNDDIAEEIRAFLAACRTSSRIYYEAAPGDWLFPSDFSGFILPSTLEETLRPELEKRGIPVHVYNVTPHEAEKMDNPWLLAKETWLKEEIDERRNDAIREFLEDHDVSFSLFGEEEDRPTSPLDFPAPSQAFPLALSPTRMAEAFQAVRQTAPVAAGLPAADSEDYLQEPSRLARQAFMTLRSATRSSDLPPHPRARRAELAKPLLHLSDGRTVYLGKAGWKRFMASSPALPTLAAMAQLPSLLDCARYLYSVPSFDDNSPEQTRAWHYYLGKTTDNKHREHYALLTFREDTRGTFLDNLETESREAIDQETTGSPDKKGNVSARPDSGFIHRAENGGSLPQNTLHSLNAFVNFVATHSGSPLRAPNGQPTRLTPDQWYLTRTTPFLDYFGDWLQTPSQSSLVLDANGEPLICYRGLKQSYNPGVSRHYTWVSSSRELSAEYAAGGPVLELFVSARRPFRFPDGLARQSPVRFLQTIKKELERDKKNSLFTEEQYRTSAEKLDSLLQGTEKTEAFKIWERYKDLKDILAALGYDSVMTEENGVMTYGLFRPGQAKSAVGNCGSYDITQPDITFSLSPQDQRTAARALVEDTYLRAPDGSPTTLTERQWLQTNSDPFKKWFGQSKILTSHREPLIVYHGTARKDRVGTVFRPERATSGPMPFFTDSREIAASYSETKEDTSIAYEKENYGDYKTQFRVTLPSGRDIPLERYWQYLSPSEQARIARTAGHIRTDWEGDDSLILDSSTDEANGGFSFHLREAHGNALRALVYHWLESATLFGQEKRFLDVLAKLELPLAPWYRDPDYREPGVYACYLRMERPFRTDKINKKNITSLKAAARKAGMAAQNEKTDGWDKNDVSPEDWIDSLEDDIKNGTAYAWTTIPDWVTACLKRLGHDGIIDRGGKFHPDVHTVYIPFDSRQLKSATGNRGTFDAASPDITFALSPEESRIAERARADGTWLLAPNGQPSRLEPGLWTLVRTRAFRDWFGDWMNDPEHASRAVDMNGEPLPVYHGSHRAGFTIFDTDLGENLSQFGTPDDCYFFSDSRDVAVTYCKLETPSAATEAELPSARNTLSPAIYTCFLNIRNPMEADFKGNYWDGRDAEDESGNDVPTTNTAALEAREQGYDAAIIRNVIDMADAAPYHLPSTVYSVFDPAQIKSAFWNRGTFDSASPDITFSVWEDEQEDYLPAGRSTAPLTAEEQSILARARDRGDDLLAPNGQPTRLSEKQWAQVRTKAFRKWFGDWERDPASASQALDENGEPLPLYHGGAFDIRDSPAVFNDGSGVDGIFFSDSSELAESYRNGRYITTAWLNLRNPFRAQNEASARLPWVDEFIDFWQDEEGWVDRYSGETMDRESVREMIIEGVLYDYDSMGSRWRDFLGWMREYHDGYLGHDPTDLGTFIAVAFHSEQIKSSVYNSGAFDASHPDITFSLSNLAALHSLSTERLLAADKLGGLPLPSLAVTRLDKPYTWGGDDNVYLVGSPALADPARGVEIHDRDVWSGHFPELRWIPRARKEREAFYQAARAASLRYYDDTDTNLSPLRFLKNALDGDHRGNLENKLRRSDPSLALFAMENGYSPRPKRTAFPRRLNAGDKLFYREILEMLQEKQDSFIHPDRKEDFLAAMERVLLRYSSQFLQGDHLTQTQLLVRKSNLRSMEKELEEARGDNFDTISWMALHDARHAGQTILDWPANYRRFEQYAARHKKAHDAWVQDKLARWLNPAPKIKGSARQATLENITAYMLGSKGAGREHGIVYSTGLLRAGQSRRFHALEEIKAARDTLVTTEENHASQETAQSCIQKLQTALNEIDDSFEAYDNAVKALSLVRGEPTRAKVLSALSSLYRGSSYRRRIAANSRLASLGVAALNALKTELRDYFEGVPQRAVLLSEFSHVVLPAALRKNKELRDVLRRHHIRPLYHDGTQEGRFRALSSLLGTPASFSLSPGPSHLHVPDSSFMASLSEEERGIAQQALATGSWLLAPNGEPSRLTPRQWVQVRTAAFKVWFGDWQDAAAHASRVIDANGEPLVVYHGTRRAGFTIFDNRKGNPLSDTPKDSHFFTPDAAVAATYSRTPQEAVLPSALPGAGIYPCFLNIRTPLEEDFRGAMWDNAGDPWFDLYDNRTQRYITPPDGSEYWKSGQAVKEYAQAHGLTDYFYYRSLSSRTTHTLAEEAKARHRDGAVIRHVIDSGTEDASRPTDIYVAFRPEQIKSATQNIGSFNPASPDITFSVIGPHAATWHKYADKAFTGRDDGKPRAEIDASRAALRDYAAPYLAPLRRELAALRRSLPDETKARIRRYLLLRRQFYGNKRTLEPEQNIPLWHEYLALSDHKEGDTRLLATAFLRAGLCHGSLPFASQLALFSTSLLVRDDRAKTAALAERGLEQTALPLADRLDYPELYEAYPQLRRLPVVTELLQDYQGLYSPVEHTIYLDKHLADPQQIRSILLHEIQHALQHIEGFARGGTPEAARQLVERKKQESARAYRQAAEFMDWLNARDGMISTLEYMSSLARHPRRVLRTSYRHTYDGIPRRLSGEERILDMARHALADLSRQLEEYYDEAWNTAPRFELPWPGSYALNTPSGISQCLEDARKTPSRRLAYRRTPKPDLQALHRDMLKYERLSPLSPRELYLRMAGETEARNVQTRLDWSETRRTAEPFNTTQDYPGETLVTFHPDDSSATFPLHPGARPANIQNRTLYLVPRTSESFSLTSLRDRGQFRQGVFHAANAAVTSPGATSFSLTAEHASPYSFRKFSEEGKNEEPRALNYGWGLYFTEDTKKSKAYETSFRSADDAREIFYLIDGKKTPASEFSPDESDILSEISANGWDYISAYVDRHRDSLEPYGVYRSVLDKYKGKTVSRVWESLPSSTVSSYQVELNVREKDLLTWEDAVPSDLLEKALALAEQTSPELYSAIMDCPVRPDRSGRLVPVRLLCPRLQECLGDKEASKWLLAQGIKGIRYYNGERIPGKKYDYVIFDEKDIKITAVRDASTRWEDFAPYRDSSATFSLHPGDSPANIQNRPSYIVPRTSESFSLTSLQDIVSVLASPSMQATRAAELVKDFDKAAQNWRRVMSGSGDRPSVRDGAALYGMINSLLSSARYVLPRGYRSRVDLQMQWASVYASMAESGEIPPKGALQSGDSFYSNFVTAMVNNTSAATSAEDARAILATIGSQRLDRVMSSVLDRVRDQLIYFAKDELYEKTMRRVEAVYPKKEPGKKSPRGRMEAHTYRLLARYRGMLDSTPEIKEEAMASLNALQHEEQDTDKRREYEEDLLAWKTYGDYLGMSLPQAQTAMEKLLEFVLSGRNAWTAKLKQERGRTKYAARQIGRNLPAANTATSRAGSKIAHRTRLRKCLASLPYSFMSYSHLMLALEPILGPRFSRARIREIAEANAALLNASNDRAAWLSAAIRHITGAKTESAAEQWLIEFNTPRQTGIILQPEITVRLTLPIEEAMEWLALTQEERAARRKEIRENDKRTETLTENVPEEEDILLLRQALDDYESRTPDQQQYQRFLTTEREIDGEVNAFPLSCSRDCALYAILLHEQDDYADKYDEEGRLIRKGFLRREGFDDAAMAALYQFVGPAGLEYGYALREKLGEAGQTLAQVYEERMGVPFALKRNYFRATFDRNSTRERDTLTEPQTGAISGGKYGSLIERIPHAENLDFSKAATLVFLATSAEQDNYIHTSHITASWRALLRDKTLEQKLRQHLGEDIMGKLASWMDLIDGASLENNRAFLHLSRMQGMLQRAFAFSVLAGNGYVLLKQSTAILHGFFAGWVPSGILDRADGSRELAHRHISFSSYLFHLAASKMGLGDISLQDVAATSYFTARMRGQGAILTQIGSQMPGQRYSPMEKPAEKLMNLIETVDVKANLHAMHALANACYARAQQLNRDNGTPFTDAELRQAALEQVGMSLELGAQPLTKTQKSISQASGGILSKLAFVMKSEQLNKLGLMAAQWQTGSARNRVCAVQSWLSLGVTSSLLAWLIAWLRGQDDDDEKKKWKKYGTTALLGDLTTIPLAGEGVNYLASLITGERVFADNYARTLIDVGAIARSVSKEYNHLADKKEMDWDAHFNNLTALVRAAGVGGAFSRSPSAVLSGYGALSLSAATGANLSRTSKDLLTTLFAPPEPKRKKKKKKRKDNSKNKHRS